MHVFFSRKTTCADSLLKTTDSYGNFTGFTYHRDRQFWAVELLCADQQDQKLELGVLLDRSGSICLAHPTVTRRTTCRSRRTQPVRPVLQRQLIQYLDDHLFRSSVGGRRTYVRAFHALSRRSPGTKYCARNLRRPRNDHGPCTAQYVLPRTRRVV